VYGSALLLLLVGGLAVDRAGLKTGRFGWAGAVYVVAFSTVALKELCAILGRAGLAVHSALLLWLGVGVLAAQSLMVAFLGTPRAGTAGVGLLGLMFAVLIFDALRVPDVGAGSRRLAGSLVGVGFVAMIGCLLHVLGRYDTNVLFSLVIAMKSSDIGAYLGGWFFGKRPLIPHVSPGKTIEGAVGGIVLTIAASALLFPALGGGRWSLGGALALGAVLSAACQLGDLAESLLKRAAGVKDSGRLVPQFGGALDMLDSLWLGAPIGLWALHGLEAA